MKLTSHGMCISWIASLAVLMATQPMAASTFSFEIPELPGSIPSGSVNTIEHDLGTQFAEVDIATLQLSGTQLLGSFFDLNFPGTFPLSAEVYAEFQIPKTGEWAFIDRILPEVNGPSSLDHLISANRWHKYSAHADTYGQMICRTIRNLFFTHFWQNKIVFQQQM